MRNLALQYRIAITFCLFTIISTGCATTNRKVDAELLEQNKNKTFKLGIVKAAGDSRFDISGASSIEFRKKALERISIAEICSILTSTFSITIDAKVDKTVKVVKEDKAVKEAILQASDSAQGSSSRGTSVSDGEEYDHWRDAFYGLVFDTALDLATEVATDYFQQLALKNAYENAYYGNLEYENASSFRIKNNEEFPDVVNVTYSLVKGFADVSFCYDINIRSSGIDFIRMHGIVGSIKITADSVNENQEAIWNSYAEFAGRISEAVKRDISKPINISIAERVSEALKKNFHPGRVSGSLNLDLSETTK